LPKLTRRDALALLLSGAAAARARAAAPAAAPLAYPHHVVTLVTHSTPGGGSDVFLRQMIRFLRRYIAATFVVENNAGGSGARAIARVAGAKPDGSVLYATTPTYILTSLLSRPARTWRDLEPLVNVFTDTEIVYTRAGGPFRTLADVIQQARTKRGRWGAANPASLERQAAERLKAAARLNAAIVSHEGGGDLMINVLNGTLDIGVGEIGETRAQLESGKIRVLAVFNAARVPGFPAVPTVKELGYDVVLEKFRGLAGPKNLPPNIIAIWEQAAQKLLADPDYRKLYAADNLVPNFIPHARYGAFVNAFADDTTRQLRQSGVIR
jgi:tripartite-type tricarboxylate transporter receptor subunit TctC